MSDKSAEFWRELAREIDDWDLRQARRPPPHRQDACATNAVALFSRQPAIKLARITALE
jgi:hypothetical protein